ncbi:MAG: hypothetical protein AAF564_26475 [Bacteroidota bacterium]
MKNIYYAGLLSAVLCLSLSTTALANDDSRIGLRADGVRMSQLETLSSAYLAPVKLMVESATMMPINGAVDAMPLEGESSIGGGLVYGSEIEKLGLQLMYYYFMTTSIALGGDVSFFFPEKTEFIGSSFTQTLITLNVVAHYVFYTSVIMRAYGLAGLNYALFRFKSEGTGFDGSDTSSELGLNIGGGIEYALATGFLFLELKYILSEFDQLVLAIGYRHVLGQ